MKGTNSKHMVGDSNNCNVCGGASPVDGTAMINEELAAQLSVCAAKYELDMQGLLDWADALLVDAALLQNIREGLMEVCGINGDGAYEFRATGEGLNHVKELLKGRGLEP